MNIFDEDRSQSLARELRDQYAGAEPFPHLIIDDFLPDEVCEAVLREFPGPGQIPWRRYKKHYSKKLAAHGDAQFGEHIQHALRQLNSADCLRFLETLTRIGGLIPKVVNPGGRPFRIAWTGAKLRVVMYERSSFFCSGR